ncbi:MAG: hypothetical protein WD469_08720 [Paenibacillaceae bacterium]
MKNLFLNRFAKSNKGSVSVYLIVILVPIFLFHAVLIDYARVKLAERETEMAVKSGLRSVLAGFDSDLQPYGLFALNDKDEQANSLFGEMIKQNLTPEYPGKYIHLLDERLNDQTNSLKSIYTLANQTVFHQQILEEMKYVAPLEYTLEIVDKFNKTEIPAQLNASKQFFANAEKLEYLLEQRNQALDEAWSSSTQFLDDAETMTLNYNLEVNVLENRDESEVIQSKNELSSRLSSDYTDLTNQYSSILMQIDDAEEKNSLLNQEKMRLMAESGLSMTENDVFKAILIYDIHYFSLYRTELGKTLALFSGLNTLMASTQTNITSFIETWKQSSNGLLQQTQGIKQNQGNLETKRQQAYNQTKLKKNEQKNKLDQALESAKGGSQGCTILHEDTYSQSYAELKGDLGGSTPGLYAKYQSYNMNTEETKETEQPFKLESGKKTSQSSLIWIQQFSAKATDFRDDLYLNEYVLNKFNYRTLQMDAPRANRSLKNQEVEYILYGLSSCSGNYAAAYGEMYVMLLAIRTMEALLKPQNELLNFGSPLLVFLAAAAQGAIEARSDMNTLLKGEAIPILQKSPKLTIDYKQLLRIFLLLHHNEERMMSRMQALIELETKSSLINKATYIQGSAVISLRLWFGLPVCKTVHNRCEIKRTAVMAY